MSTGGDALTVGHVNYTFFHSTQSFIYFYLTHQERVRPICLTRGRESPAVDARIPAALAGQFYTFTGEGRKDRLDRVLSRSGIALRRGLSHLPPRAAAPVLDSLQRHVVPRLRADADPRRFVDWTQDILERREAGLIHAYFGAVGWRMLECRPRLGIPLVVTFLGDDIADSLSPWWSWWIRTGREAPNWPARLQELFQQADLLLVEGPFLRDRVLALGCPPEKVQVQRIGIPVDETPFRPARARRDGRAVIVFAGRFCEQKGLLFALDAVRRLRDEGRQIEFRVIGDDTMTDGSYASHVHAFVRAHRLHDCVRMLGFMNHDEYLRELRDGDIYLHPSVFDASGAGEGGAPTTILEAQAVGLPVVSTEHCDIPNVTLPGVSSVLVPERDGAALAQALRDLLDNPGRWEQMGRSGREHVARYHDIVIEARRLEERYLALTDRSPARPLRGDRRGSPATEAPAPASAPIES